MSKYKHITEPDGYGYQVRIGINKVEHSRYFAHKQWRSKSRSIRAALSWRDQMLVALQHAELCGKQCASNNVTTGVNGVSSTILHDSRRNTDTFIYQSLFKFDGKVRNRKFCVGRIEHVNADDYLHAFLTAKQFRQEYELSADNNTAFDHARFKPWKTCTLYNH
jgi:hypothetical protein